MPEVRKGLRAAGQSLAHGMLYDAYLPVGWSFDS